MVIDHEDGGRRVMTTMLDFGGYTVVSASDGCRGADIYQREGEQIDCVFRNLSIPKRNAEEALQELRKLDPNVRVVLASGFTEREMLDRFRAAGLSGVLQKPVLMSSLLTKVRAAIESPDRAAD